MIKKKFTLTYWLRKLIMSLRIQKWFFFKESTQSALCAYKSKFKRWFYQNNFIKYFNLILFLRDWCSNWMNSQASFLENAKDAWNHRIKERNFTKNKMKEYFTRSVFNSICKITWSLNYKSAVINLRFNN